MRAICPVMVSAESKGLKLKLGPAPAAIATIMVSPMARETATMNAARMPESAAGSTTLMVVSSLVAPKP